MPQLKDLDVQWVSLVDRAAVRDLQKTDEPRRFLIWKSETATDPAGGGPTMTDAEKLAKAEQERDELRKQLEDQTTLKASLTKAEEERDAVKAELEKAAKPENKPGEINKADLPEPVRLALEKAETEREEARKEAKAAHDIAKAERDERLTRDFIAKAETYQALPVDAAKFGPVLKTANEHLSKDEYEQLETVLKAADEQIAKGELFKEQGRSGEAQTPKGAVAELQQKAAEIRKNDPKVTVAKAMDIAMADNPDLQTRYLAEVRG